MNPEDFDHILANPLLTEDGFLNEACLNELASAIKNMPKTYERCADDPEWSKKRITHYREITGGLAHWAVRQLGSGSKDCTLPFPPNLEKVVGYLHACIRKKFDEFGWTDLSLCDISKMLYDILYEQNVSVFDEWNTKEVLGEHWLDLDALLHNVCLTIRQERREHDRFDAEFEAKYGKLSDEKNIPEQ